MIHDTFVAIDDKISKSRAFIYNSQFNHQRKKHPSPTPDPKIIDNAPKNEEIDQNPTNHETDNQNEDTQIKPTPQPNIENTKHEIEDTKFNRINSLISEIKSIYETKPDYPTRLLRFAFTTLQKANIGKNNDYWEFQGQNGNITFRFPTGLISGIELNKTNRKCEIKYFDILIPGDDYCILKKSQLNSSSQIFNFPIAVRTNELKLHILENEGDPKLTCLFNYSILSKTNSENGEDHYNTDDI